MKDKEILIKQAEIIAKLLKDGKVVIFPTETLYALSCIANNSDAIERVYDIKKRDFSKPLAIFVKDIEMAKKIAHISEFEENLMRKFMPGALTILLKAKQDNDKYIANNFNKVNSLIAIRIPDHGLSMEILKQVDKPIIATSSNLSNQDNLTSINQIRETFTGIVDDIFDNIDPNEKFAKQPSTIIQIEKDDHQQDKITVIRKGVIEF